MANTSIASSPDQVAPLITALATLLLRRCVGAAAPGDAETGRVLCRRLMEVEAPAEILAVATGAVWSAFRPDGELDDSARGDIAEVARLFVANGGFDGLVALSAACLVLMARRGFSNQKAHDLVLAGGAAWELEHHHLALLACQEALAESPIEDSDRDKALAIVARVSRDAQLVAALSSASTESETDATAQTATTVGNNDAESSWAKARDATLVGDRATAARHMADVTAELRTQTSRDAHFLDGLTRAFRAMADEQVDVPALREGLIAVVRQLRERQRFGNVPPAVRAALELVILILKSAPSEGTGSVLCELLEALADAGLSEVTLTPSVKAGAAEAEARLVEQATAFPLWPDLAACVEGLEGNFALLCRRVGGGQSSTERWISLFVIPPDGVLIKDGPLSSAHVALLQTFRAGEAQGIGRVRASDLDDLLAGFVHTEALRRLDAEPSRGLIVIPDGDQWSVPWQAAPRLATRLTTISPSMTVYQRLQPLTERVATVSALIDDSVDGAADLIDELVEARSRGTLSVDFAPASLGRPTDLLLVLAHGRGDGLRFELSLPHETIGAYEIASRSRSRSAVVASCWSAKAPPVAMPLNLPVSLLMNGASFAAGGGWPLPQRTTASTLTLLIRSLAAGNPLSVALADARTPTAPVGDYWGLIAAGRIPPWPRRDIDD